MRLARAFTLAALIAASPFLAAATASATPKVAVTLAQATVVTGSDGTPHLVPLTSGVPVTHGATIRYTVTANNTSSEAARRLALTGHVPEGTAFTPGSVRGPGGHAEYSLDGTTFSTQPMVPKETPNGKVMVPADPALYVMVRWVKDGPLAATSTIAFSYDVLLK